MPFKFFYFFFEFNILAVASYVFSFPATEAKTLEEMDELFCSVISSSRTYWKTLSLFVIRGFGES
jgi:hypothetical protein